MSSSTILLLVLFVFLSLIVSFFQYYKKDKQKRIKHWILFGALRFITFLSLLLLLLPLKFSNYSYHIEKPTLAIAVDNSSSIKNIGKTKEVTSFLNKLVENPNLQEKFSVEVFSFGETVKKLPDSLMFSDKHTDIAQVFNSFSSLYQDEKVATVLLTDGNATYGKDYITQAKLYKHNVYSVILGDTVKHPDIRIDRVNVNKYAFLGNTYPVEVHLSYTGKQAVAKKLSFYLGEKLVATQTLKFNEQHAAEILTVMLQADKVGIHSYKIKIENLEGEKNILNNQREFAIEVLDQQTNILLLSSFLHPDIGAFKKAITHNKQRRFTLKKPSDEIDFSAYQLVILYQPDQTFSKVIERIKQVGINYLFIGGTKTDYNFFNTQQQHFTKQVSGSREEYLPQESVQFQLFQIPELGVEGFPPVQDVFGRLSFNTPTQTLLEKTVNGFATEEPLITFVEDANKRYGYLFGENTWQWRASSFLKEGNFEVYDDFVEKIVQFLVSNTKKERLKLDYKTFYKQGEAIYIRASYFDKTYAFDERKKLQLRLSSKSGDATQQLPLLLKQHYYEVDLSNSAPGDYTFKISVLGENIEKSGALKIIPFDVEQQHTSANLTDLKRVGGESGLYFLDKPNVLIDYLLNTSEYTSIQKAEKSEKQLIDWKLLLGILVLSLSLEWFLRKYYGLI